MANGVPPYYLPPYTQDTNRQSFQYDSPSSGLGMMNSVPGSTGEAAAYDATGLLAGFHGQSPAGTMPSHHGNGFSQQYGLQQSSTVPIEFRDAFGTPMSSASGHMIGMPSSTQIHGTVHQGAITQSPTSMHESSEQASSSLAQTMQREDHHRPRQNTGSDIAEGVGEEPPKKKKKGKNGEALPNGSGSGTEDKEKEKEKDNRRKT